MATVFYQILNMKNQATFHIPNSTFAVTSKALFPKIKLLRKFSNPHKMGTIFYEILNMKIKTPFNFQNLTLAVTSKALFPEI